MRKNIFKILSDNFDVNHEIMLIWKLFDNAIIYVPYDINTPYGRRHFDDISIMECVDSYSFVDWKARVRCASSQDMMDRLDINEKSISKLSGFSLETQAFMEFMVNIIKRCDIAMQENNLDNSESYEILKQNTEAFLEHFGHTTTYFEEEEKVIIIEKNSAAFSAAEISEPDIAKKIIQYNHYKLKGNIDAKKDIILALANEIEPKRNELEQLNSVLADDLFFTLNNMNLRHNNKEPSDKFYKPYVANMDVNDLECWYDEIYQMILLVKLLIENKTRHDDIDTLKGNF